MFQVCGGNHLRFLINTKTSIQTPVRRSVLDKTLCDKVCQRLATGRWFSSGTPVSSCNKTDLHDITEILLKVALNTINLPKASKLTENHKNIFFQYHNLIYKVVSEKKIFKNFSQSEYITGSGSHVEFSISIKNSSLVFINYHLIKEKSKLWVYIHFKVHNQRMTQTKFVLNWWYQRNFENQFLLILA